MAPDSTFEATSCSVSIDHSVETKNGIESVDAGNSITLEFTAVGGHTFTVGMKREAFNRFLLEHLHLAEVDPSEAPPVTVGRSGGSSG